MAHAAEISYANPAAFDPSVVYSPFNPEYARFLGHLVSFPAPTGVPRTDVLCGFGGSGKSTVASSAALHLGWQLVPIDAWLPFNPDQPPQVNSGWTEYEWDRFYAEIIIPRQRGEGGSYRPRDWLTGAEGPLIRLEPDVPVLVEGVGVLAALRLNWFNGTRTWLKYPRLYARRDGIQRTQTEPQFIPYWRIWSKTDRLYYMAEQPQKLATFTFDRLRAQHWEKQRELWVPRKAGGLALAT